MVDKIDRPDVPASYRINESKHATDDQHQRRQQPEDPDAHYQQQAEHEWDKFHRSEQSIKWTKIQTDRVLKCRYQHAALRQGTPFLLADIVWTNGTTTANGLLLLQRFEDVLKLKRLQRLDEVPREFWAYKKEIELGILQSMGQSGLHRQSIMNSEYKKGERDKGVEYVKHSHRKGIIVALLFILIVALLILFQSIE
ncbi:MAG: hypothetical protein A3I05_03475 [Deltaproteobacteria bacterium RIFCSPLOWO2_02_FULL_44_10]|nr:MAG: hypothetical protein A3C46_03050 [Deltaproteobacteria bacterium RIFCSPHIGHO2_02_FULL_44_16]OGQ46233.1 MAG: hypothetical protein A3I05_03475 [Deltaproteobacteria bacterium RIFCSPLOWO2_02_FULL_44_10]